MAEKQVRCRLSPCGDDVAGLAHTLQGIAYYLIELCLLPGGAKGADLAEMIVGDALDVLLGCRKRVYQGADFGGGTGSVCGAHQAVETALLVAHLLADVHYCFVVLTS